MASAALRLAKRFEAGLQIFNQLRKEFRNLPQSWLSRGYQQAKAIGKAIFDVQGNLPGSRPTLSQIPVIPGLPIGDSLGTRILYRFQVRLFEKYGRTPKTFIVDVTSISPLSAADLQQQVADRALQTYASSPGARRGGNEKDIREVDSTLIYVGRRF